MAESNKDVAGKRALLYEESVRKLSQQVSALDNLRTRTGVLLSAGAIASTFLGAQALNDGSIGCKGWAAIVVLGCFGLLALAVLWPLKVKWRFAHGIEALIDQYADREDVSLDKMQYEMARMNQENWDYNAEILERLYWLYRLAALALIVEVGLWLVDLGSG